MEDCMVERKERGGLYTRCENESSGGSESGEKGERKRIVEMIVV
jgi:hypothetical protein